MKQVPEWWHWPMGFIGVLMGWVAYLLGTHYGNALSCMLLSVVFAVISYQQAMSSLNKKKDTVSWFITWNTFGILACIAVGFWIALMYFASRH